jgi:hypothetical protein
MVENRKFAEEFNDIKMFRYCEPVNSADAAAQPVPLPV